MGLPIGAVLAMAYSGHTCIDVIGPRRGDAFRPDSKPKRSRSHTADDYRAFEKRVAKRRNKKGYS